MNKKHHKPAPIPPDNRPANGPAGTPDNQPAERTSPADGTGFDEQDPKRRLGDFTGAGEHSIQQPGGRYGGNKKQLHG